jgi:hypothetical protein
MEEINILLAQSGLNLAITAMEYSLNDIKEKHSERTDLISSMERHLNGLLDSMIVFRELEKDNRTLRKMNMNYHIENMELRFQNEQLKKANQELINGL